MTNGNVNELSSLISSSSPDSSIQTGPPPLPPHQPARQPAHPPEQPNYVNTSEVHQAPPLLKRQQNYNCCAS